MVSPLDPVLTHVWRGAQLEALHRGAIAVTAPDGDLSWAYGDVTTAFLPRSAIKPLQAIAMLCAGLDVTGAELALVGASHAGEPFHVAGVADILDGAGLTPEALGNTPDVPEDPAARAAWYRSGRDAEPVAMNCSGKHAGMLRTCVRAGWPTEGYLRPDHPLQRAIAEVLAEFTGEAVDRPEVDGCGAPAFPTTLTGLARAFGRLAGARDGEARAVADAFRWHPTSASGTHRDEAVVPREVPGLVGKAGAEGTVAVGLADGTGVAIKVADGAHRGWVRPLVAVLAALGHGTEVLDRLDPLPILGHGRPVGGADIDPDLGIALARLASSAETPGG